MLNKELSLNMLAHTTFPSTIYELNREPSMTITTFLFAIFLLMQSRESSTTLSSMAISSRTSW